jgi:3-oxoacyl-[acyl-carrier-protein] synthase-3
VYLNIDRYGNTSGASIPVAMCEAWELGLLAPGDRLLLLAFGGGYTWGGATIRWNLPSPADRPVGAAAAGASPSPDPAELLGVGT